MAMPNSTLSKLFDRQRFFPDILDLVSVKMPFVHNQKEPLDKDKIISV